MLGLYDRHTRAVEELRPTIPGELRIYACGPAAHEDVDVGHLRTFLLADLIRRAAELHGLRVRSDQNRTDGDHLADDLATLNIHPADPHPRGGEHIDVRIGGVDPRMPHHEDERAQSDAASQEVVGHRVHAEHMLVEGRDTAQSAGNAILPTDVGGSGLDPLALRLALLKHHYRQRMDLPWDDLRAAAERLSRWRTRVAEWAESPSAPMCADYVARVRTAFDDDLDTPTAVRAARELEEDGEIPAGSKFEAFAYLDRLFGLDLARDIGKPREAPLTDAARELLHARSTARAERDFATSDRLRDELAAMGVRVTDTPQGQTWSALPLQ